MGGRVLVIGVVGEHLKDPFVVVRIGYDDFRPGEPHHPGNVVGGGADMQDSPRVLLRPMDELVFGRECYTFPSGKGDAVGEIGHRVVFGTGKIIGRKALEWGMQDVPIIDEFNL